MLLPGWWVILSGIFFAVGIAFTVLLIVGGLVAWRKVGPLIGELQQKVHSVGESTSRIAGRAETVVEMVQAKTATVLDGIEATSTAVTRRLSSAGGIVVAAYVAARVVSMMRARAGLRRE